MQIAFNINFPYKMLFHSRLFLILVFHAQVAKTINSLHYENNFCTFMYNSVSSPQSPNKMDPFTFIRQPCFCDEECWKYGDCCKDAPRLSNSKLLDTSVKMFCQKITHLNPSVYVIKTCPSNWSDDNTRSLCLKEVESENYHYLLDMPVYSENKKHLYANTFCSICNNDRINASFLQLAATCRMNCEFKFKENSFYVNGQLKWIMPNQEEINTIIVDPRYSNVRRCRETVDKCLDNWPDESVVKLCEEYNYYTRGYSGVIYKNSHCAQCNYDNMGPPKYMTSRKKITFDSMVVTHGAFNFILDFTFLPDNRQCFGRNEIYDEFLGACLPILCGRNYELIDGMCQLKNQSQEISLNSSRFSCTKTTIQKDELHIFINGTIYRNRTQTIFYEDEYEVVNNETYLLCIKDGDFKYYDSFSVRHFSPIQNYLSTVCLFISLISLAAHIAIYFFLDKHRKLPDRTLLSLSVALFIGQTLYLFGLSRTGNEDICYFIGVLIHFFYLAVFFWMNVMAFDICRTLSQSHRRTWKNKTFYYYSVYAWLFPLIIVITSVNIDQLYTSSNIRPQYGRDMCWISDRYALFLFFALPVGFILVVNVILFFVTSCNVCITEKQNSGIIKLHDRRRFQVYIKLALALGLTWIVGFAAAFTDIESLWYGFIILNASQGTFIFTIFTLKQQVLCQFWQKLTGKSSMNKYNSRRTEITSLRQRLSTDRRTE